MDKLQALKEYFGHSAFRTGQEELIDALLAGRDVFGIMPTGGGKSICYQLPALLLEGTALVVSPLISLMKDQVMALTAAGIPAAYVNSSLTGEQMRQVYRNLREGRYKIVYAAPERLDADGFVSLAKTLKISLVAVDEAHCISQWGQDFRPSYLRIVSFLEKLPERPPLAAFTATATAGVREDVARILQLRRPLCVTTGFDRPNLYFEVLRPKNKDSALLELVAQRRGKSGIVYCATRNNVEKVCRELRAAGVAATRYHAGLEDAERRKNQEDFLYDRCPVMAATNAFGMGIDKSNVGFVIHYNMPKSLEAYYQEAGRAGRDGEKADCLLLYSAGDVRTAEFLIRNSGENGELTEEERRAVEQRDRERLRVMAGYCKTTACLRGYILDYFGQAHEETCGSCGNCRAVFTTRDVTAEAQMILSCVKRARDRLGYSVGASLIQRTLAGGADKRVLELGLDKLSTYGLMKGTPRPRLAELMEKLQELGYLRTDPQYGGVELTEAAGAVLFRGEKVETALREAPEEKRRRGKRPAPSEDAAAPSLFEDLKALRFELARRENVPAYVVFSNATLADMAAKAPENLSEFLEVSGVGAVKCKKYGKIFTERIRKFQNGG